MNGGRTVEKRIGEKSSLSSPSIGKILSHSTTTAAIEKNRMIHTEIHTKGPSLLVQQSFIEHSNLTTNKMRASRRVKKKEDNGGQSNK